jgi:hypothetical protein
MLSVHFSIGQFNRKAIRPLKPAATKANDKSKSTLIGHLNLQLARTYLAATDPMVAKRTWQVPMDELGKTKRGPTLVRWQRAIRDKAFDLIRDLPTLE